MPPLAGSPPADARRRSTGSRPLVLIVCAVLAPLLYFMFVAHFAVDVPYVDDWSAVPLVVAARHGHLHLGALWQQWGPARWVTGRIVFIVFGVFDHLNEKSVLLFAAAVFSLTYLMILWLLRGYLSRAPSPLLVLVIGIIWFSIVDWGSALWPIRVNNYLALFFVVLAILLLSRRASSRLLLAAAAVAALLASLSFTEGFLAWPIGALCIYWRRSAPRWRVEMVGWVLVALLTSVLYLRGFNTAATGCGQAGRCGLTYGLLHPGALIEYFILLVGNVVPLTQTGLEAHLGVHLAQGLLLLGLAVVAVVMGIREQFTGAVPLPLLLIIYSLGTDALTTIGRAGTGAYTAMTQGDSRYTMPNVVLLVALLIFGAEHLSTSAIRRPSLRVAALACSLTFLSGQTVLGSTAGLSNASRFRQHLVVGGRIAENVDRIPAAERDCYVNYAEYAYWSSFVVPWFRLAKVNHLSLFQAKTAHWYRIEGPPTLGFCNTS